MNLSIDGLSQYRIDRIYIHCSRYCPQFVLCLEIVDQRSCLPIIGPQPDCHGLLVVIGALFQLLGSTLITYPPLGGWGKISIVDLATLTTG